MEAPPVLEPKRLKVFGVIDIVFGGLGLLYMALNVVGLLAQDVVQKMSSAGQPEEVVEFQRRFTEATMPSSIISIILGTVVSAVVLVAGIALVRRKKNSIKLSNLYAFISIAAKVVTVVIFLTMIMPALNELMDDLVKEMAADAPGDVKQMLDIMKASATGAGILVPVLMCIYPILSLVLLNKPKVREFLQQHGQ